MPDMLIRPLAVLRTCNGMSFLLPNGVGIFSDGSLVVADGGNDRVCLLAPNSRLQKAIGGKGLGRYRFKEPVGVFVSPDEQVYVADWHNHRIAVYDKCLDYIGEFGHYGTGGATENCLTDIRSILSSLKFLAFTGSYIPRHYSAHEQQLRGHRYSLRLLLSGLCYASRMIVRYTFGSRLRFFHEHALNKPNGVAFRDEYLLVSQKNARCVSVYQRQWPHQLIRHLYGPSKGVSFGRLGNLACDSQGALYVCDEHAHVIWKLDRDLQLIGEITGADSGLGSFMPFSCCLVDEDMLAVCGGLNFQIIDQARGIVLYRSEDLGELHGIAFDRRTNQLYIADRSNGVIRVFEIVSKEVVTRCSA